MQNVNIFIIAHIAHFVVSPISACIAWQRVVSTQNDTFLSILRKQSIDVQCYYTMKHETSGWLYTVDLASRRWMDSKMQWPELCLSFSLNDDMAMTPTMKISSFPRVVVEARVSKSGQAVPTSGDLQGFSEPVNLGQNDISIVIDQQVP